MAKQQAKDTENKEQNKSQKDDAQKSSKPEQQGSDKAIAGDAETTADVSQELNELLETLNGDLHEIEAEAALELVDQWHDLLHKAKEPEIKEVSSSLKELRKLLKSDKTTGHEVGEVLTKLGEQVSQVASKTDELKAPLQKLGKQLGQTATAVGKAEDQEYLEDINTLVETLEEGDVTSLEVDDAVGMIDMWHNLVQKADGQAFEEIASSLKDLKQVLKRSSAKPEAIAEVLTKLGEQTSEVASEAPRGFKTVIQKLGKQLSAAGKQIESAK
jgi:ABC-type transporter Mla subunit MlaD